MPENATVIINYAAYSSFGVVEHREMRLKGIKSIDRFHLFTKFNSLNLTIVNRLSF